MKLEDALAAYLYLKDQYEPTLAERAVRKDAWETIARFAKNTIAHEIWLKGGPKPANTPALREGKS